MRGANGGLNDSCNTLKKIARHHLARFELGRNDGVDGVGFADGFYDGCILNQQTFAKMSLLRDEFLNLLHEKTLNLCDKVNRRG